MNAYVELTLDCPIVRHQWSRIKIIEIYLIYQKICLKLFDPLYVFSVFQILKSEEKMANFVKYSRKNENFYLAAERDMEVQLRVSKRI